MTDIDLIRTIKKAMAELKTLIDKLPDESAEKQRLRSQRNELRAERDRTLGKSLDRESVQYAAATKALEEGLSQVQAAINDLEQIANTISKMAAVITQIGKLAVV
jgi:chromosome segregation ATPase